APRRPRPLAMVGAWLLAVAQPHEQLRQRQPRPGGGDASVAARLGALARARRKLRAPPTDAGRPRASARRGRSPNRRRIARALLLCRRPADAAPPRRRQDLDRG